MLHGYLYDTSSAFCVANSQNRWRMALRQSSDVADVGTLVSGESRVQSVLLDRGGLLSFRFLGRVWFNPLHLLNFCFSYYFQLSVLLFQISMLHSHIIWPELRSLKVLTENQYVCDENTFVQRIIGGFPFSKHKTFPKDRDKSCGSTRH